MSIVNKIVTSLQTEPNKWELIKGAVESKNLMVSTKTGDIYIRTLGNNNSYKLGFLQRRKMRKAIRKWKEYKILSLLETI